MGRKCPDMRTVAIKRVLLCERFQKEQKQACIILDFCNLLTCSQHGYMSNHPNTECEPGSFLSNMLLHFKALNAWCSRKGFAASLFKYV